MISAPGRSAHSFTVLLPNSPVVEVLGGGAKRVSLVSCADCIFTCLQQTLEITRAQSERRFISSQPQRKIISSAEGLGEGTSWSPLCLEGTDMPVLCGCAGYGFARAQHLGPALGPNELHFGTRVFGHVNIIVDAQQRLCVWAFLLQLFQFSDSVMEQIKCNVGDLHQRLPHRVVEPANAKLQTFLCSLHRLQDWRGQ